MVHHDQVGFTVGPSHQQAEEKSHNYIYRYRKSMTKSNTIKHTEFQWPRNKGEISLFDKKYL